MASRGTLCTFMHTHTHTHTHTYRAAGGEQRRGTATTSINTRKESRSTPKRRENSRHRHMHESRLSRQAPAMNEGSLQRYVGRSRGQTSTSKMTREERKIADELRLFEQLQARQQAAMAPQDDGQDEIDEIENWAECKRCKKWRKLGVSAASYASSAPETGAIPAAEVVVVAVSQDASGNSSFVCTMAGDVTCDTPEDISWVSRPAFDPFEEAPTLELCLAGLEHLAFKIPEEGYLHTVGIDMQGSMVKEIRETPMESVKEVGDMLKRVISYIDKQFMKNRWKLRQQEGWEEAIDEALCADTIFDAGIKVEKSGIDWGRLQILREETHGAASGSHDKVSDIARACVQYTCLRIEVLTSYNIHLLQAGVQF